MFRSPSLTRWIVGLVAMFAFSASTLEVMIPDVHDGDATSLTSAAAAHMHQGAPQTPNDGPAAPHHAQHVDHCSHAHVAAVTGYVALAKAPPRDGMLPTSHANELLSVSGRPSFRPPITQV